MLWAALYGMGWKISAAGGPKARIGPSAFSEASSGPRQTPPTAMIGSLRKIWLLSQKCNGSRGPLNASSCELTGV